MRLLITFLLLLSCTAIFSQKPSASEQITTLYSPSKRPRMVAEWEPAIGVLIAWPLSIPYQLVINLSKDIKLYVLVENTKSKQDAIQWFTRWNIFPDRIKFITAPQGVDVSWTRDWGPHAVFTQDGVMKLADGRYRYATPMTGLSCSDTLTFLYFDEKGKIEITRTDDDIPSFISSSTGIDMISLPFAFTGGNVISDGQRAAFSTCVLINEKKYDGVSEEQFRQNAELLLGIEDYHFLSHFEEKGIQHIDCFMKMLDEERLLVIRPPVDHPMYSIYEEIVTKELSQLRNAYGRPYQILRLDTDRYKEDELAAYSNSLILNKVVYVPLFGIKQDSVAMRQWRDAMPGYTVKGFEFKIDIVPTLRDQVFELYEGIGWTSGDALHCRTRAIWDPEMIYISVNRLQTNIKKAKEYPVQVIIKDYSQSGLEPDSLQLHWRVSGKPGWKSTTLVPTAFPDQFSGAIQGGQAGVTIEYYVSAGNKNKRTYTMPATAPEGTYTCKIN